MAKIQIIRSLVTERLSAAAEEIFGLFERTIIEYEGEIDRQRKLLHVLTPEMRTDSWPPQLLVSDEEVPPELQERSSHLPGLEEVTSLPASVKHERGGDNSQILEPQLPQIKNEPDQGAEEADVNATVLPVKCEDRQENALPFQPLHTQRQKPIEAEPLPTTSAEPDGENWDTSEPASYSDAAGSEPVRDGRLLSSDCSGPETDDNDEELKGSETCLPGFKTLKTETAQTAQSCSFDLSDESSYELKPSTHIVSTTCKVCRIAFPNTLSLNKHVTVHASDCGLCGRHLQLTESLKTHLKAHRVCPICGKAFSENIDIVTHMRSHSDKKRFGCSLCGKGFRLKGDLQRHLRTHSKEQPFSCSICGKRFSLNGNLKTHMRTHSNERPFSCFVCGKGFSRNGNLKAHIRTHLNDKPFSCFICGKGFCQRGNLKGHMRTHLNEKTHPVPRPQEQETTNYSSSFHCDMQPEAGVMSNDYRLYC